MCGEEVGAADHMLCKHLMEEAARPIEDAARFSRVAGHYKGVAETEYLKSEMITNICICSATQVCRPVYTF